MKLRCLSRYSSSLGSFKPGDVFDVPDRIGGEIMRSSPESFEEVRPAAGAGKESEPGSSEESALAAMSTETDTGLVVPDRRMRGGKLRNKK